MRVAIAGDLDRGVAHQRGDRLDGLALAQKERSEGVTHVMPPERLPEPCCPEKTLPALPAEVIRIDGNTVTSVEYQSRALRIPPAKPVHPDQLLKEGSEVYLTPGSTRLRLPEAAAPLVAASDLHYRVVNPTIEVLVAEGQGLTAPRACENRDRNGDVQFPVTIYGDLQ